MFQTLFMDGAILNITVKNYPKKLVKKYKEVLMEKVKNGRELDAWEFAEEQKIEIDLSLICFDELISEGIIEKVK